MILQALHNYYERQSKASPNELAPIGFELKYIPFVIELSKTGSFLQLEDTRELKGKKIVAKTFMVPKAKIRSGSRAYEKPNILWDHYGFVLNYPKQEKEKPPLDKDVKTAKLQHKFFIEELKVIYKKTGDEAVHIVLRFLECGDFVELFSSEKWKECSEIKGCNLSFKIQGNSHLVCQSKDIIKFIKETSSKVTIDEASKCLVTGKKGLIARLHPAISGVGKKPAPLSSVNDGALPALSSFGKHQGFNFPVGEQAVFAYTTALNHLLRQDSPQRMQVGDTSTVFWAEEMTDFEAAVPNIFGEPSKDEPDRNVRAVEQLFKSIHNGRYSGEDKDHRFYVLGLAPNAARIAIRFWYVSTVAELAEHIAQHFADLEIIHAVHEMKYLPLFRLLVSTASLGKSENIPPNLAGETMRAILAGQPYPQTLLGAVVRRIKAEQAKKDKDTHKQLENVTYPRVALLKAYTNRILRYKKSNKEKIKMSLDIENKNEGYRLGRLFAVLEEMQKKAHDRNLNSTIRDRYYGSASSAPNSVFPTLLKLSSHHLRKMENKKEADYLENLKGSIIDGISANGFSAILTLEDQGRFAIGYYHQRKHPSTYYKGSKND